MTMRKAVTYKDRSQSLGLTNALSITLVEAHEALYGACQKGTQDRSWQSIRKLSKCIVTLGFRTAIQFQRNILSTFFNWLSNTEITEASKQSDMIIVRAIMHWCEHNVPEILEGALIVEPRNFFRQDTGERSSLSEQDSRLVMRSALKEIDEITERIRAGRIEVSERSTKRGELISRLLEIGNGRIPIQTTVTLSKESLSRRVSAEGGLKQLYRTIFPTPRDLLPFYVAIQFQLAGNPQAVAKLRRDCIQKNELRGDREWVIWDKHRATRIQRADFPAGKATSAPALIRKLNELTEPLTELEKINRELVFLAYERGRIAIPSLQTWHNSLIDFRKQHSLPEFSFVQLRRTSAVLHHEASGSILIARQKLNHASVATTVRYSTYENIGDLHDQKIYGAQQELKRVIQNQPARQLDKCAPKTPADTVFGFQCSDPFAGHIKETDSSRPCDHFHRCATCPGALIPLDRPDVIAAILKSRSSLLSARERAVKEGWLPRFLVLYQSTLDAIVSELLPKVPAHVIEAAEVIAKSRPFPSLE